MCHYSYYENPDLQLEICENTIKINLFILISAAGCMLCMSLTEVCLEVVREMHHFL